MNSALKLVEVEFLLFSYGCVGGLHTKHSHTRCRLKKFETWTSPHTKVALTPPKPSAMNTNTKPQTQTKPRRSTRLAAKPQVAYLQAELRLDAAVEKYVDPDAYAAKKTRAAQREAVRKADRDYHIARRDARLKLAKTISDIAIQITNARSECKTLSPLEMHILERDAKEFGAKDHPMWTPGNLTWAFKYVTGH
jgi:hypothetical protein